jgi:uncharacterized protein YndB with AHSA1/START domain
MSEYQARYHFDDYFYSSFQEACEISATPGMFVAFLAFDRSDVPENAPDMWQVAWLIAPCSAIFWTALLFGAWKLKNALNIPRVTAELKKPMTTFETSREIPAAVEQVFAAISDPERLARWWGPAGFTNTFNVCEFKNGGRWSFIMHAPNGNNYPNENVFAEIESPRKVIIQHASEPKFCLTILLASAAVGTVVSWSQAFESSEVASRLEHIVVLANEENLERLSVEVLHKPGGRLTGPKPKNQTEM